MLPKAPKVEVFGPTTLYAGRTATIEIVVTGEQPTRIEYIDAHITGHQGWELGSGSDAVGTRVRYPDLVAHLREQGELPAGISRFRTTFELPRDMPPSHDVSPAWAYLEVYVRVAIPWWPDGKYRFLLPVRVPPPSDVTRTPLAIRSDAAPGAPRLELSLASTRLVAGETVVGSIAVFHLDDSKPRDVDISLVPTLRLYRGGSYRTRAGNKLAVTITIPARAAGKSVPFRFALPPTITPSFRAGTHDLAWCLVATTGSFFGTQVELAVPIEICDSSTSALTAKLHVAPRLTDVRIAAAFEEFAAAHGWRSRPFHDAHDRLTIEREVDGSVLRISYAYLGEAGSVLTASIVGPRLGLDLSVTPSSRVRELLGQDIEIDLAEWDRTHRVRPRSAAQTVPFLRAAVPALITATHTLGALVEWTDDELELRRKVSTVDVATLAATKAALEQLAASLAAIPIAPPPGVEVDLDAWQQLARRLAGRISPGDLSIDGTLERVPVSIVLEFAGEQAVRVRVHAGDPLHTGNREPLTEEERASWPADFVELTLTDGVASAALSIATPGRAAVIDVRRVHELVTALCSLITRRDSRRGPFR